MTQPLGQHLVSSISPCSSPQDKNFGDTPDTKGAADDWKIGVIYAFFRQLLLNGDTHLLVDHVLLQHEIQYIFCSVRFLLTACHIRMLVDTVNRSQSTHWIFNNRLSINDDMCHACVPIRTDTLCAPTIWATDEPSRFRFTSRQKTVSPVCFG